MPRIDFKEIDDVQDFAPLPAGTYLCRLVDVEKTTTRQGSEMWRLRWAVQEGPQRGRYLFDNMVFSAAAMKRVKHICAQLKLDVSGTLELTPAMIKGRTCRVTVETEEYEDHEGMTKRRNVVPFAGYESAGGAAGPNDGAAGNAMDDDDLPF